ncbi:MAG TPA: endolytic transglycosylase MltG [Gaiellaceae bacterium]|nr:endolytic transglycosylase MltG [Gaiellaceae bacterium]
MVEQRVPLSPPEPPRRRPRSSRGQLALRRAIALVLLLGGLGLAVWLVTVAVGGGDKKKPAPAIPVAPPSLKIVFPEGFTRAQMAERISAVDRIAREKRKITARLSARAYLKATASSLTPGKFARDGKRRPLEGFLFPATYDFEARTTSRHLVEQQFAAFQRNWSKVNLRYAKSKNLTPYDVLIIASMIEKEVAAPEERALVSAVIYNRLHDGMSLGIDATIRYGLGVPPTESLKESQLHSSNPYNTGDGHVGLPPTPIANPGLASMQAAAHPAKVNYLFFVRKPDKIHHFFTASETEFNNYKLAHGYR